MPTGFKRFAICICHHPSQILKVCKSLHQVKINFFLQAHRVIFNGVFFSLCKYSPSNVSPNFQNLLYHSGIYALNPLFSWNLCFFLFFLLFPYFFCLFLHSLSFIWLLYNPINFSFIYTHINFFPLWVMNSFSFWLLGRLLLHRVSKPYIYI